MKKLTLNMVVIIVLVFLFTGTTVYAATQVFSGTSGNSWISLVNSSNNSSYLLHNAADGSNLEFATSDNGTMHWQVLNVAKNGEVRIGQPSDESRLTVDGKVSLFTNSTVMGLHNANGTNDLTFTTGSTVGDWIVEATKGIKFTVADSTEVEINGNGLFAKQVTIKSSWADYVFNKDYRLMPLKDLEEYIKLNKHLPNIPASDNIENSGLNLGEMQKAQMEKIEELTLYIMQQNKELQILKHEIKDLKN